MSLALFLYSVFNFYWNDRKPLCINYMLNLTPLRGRVITIRWPTNLAHIVSKRYRTILGGAARSGYKEVQPVHTCYTEVPATNPKNFPNHRLVWLFCLHYPNDVTKVISMTCREHFSFFDYAWEKNYTVSKRPFLFLPKSQYLRDGLSIGDYIFLKIRQNRCTSNNSNLNYSSASFLTRFIIFEFILTRRCLTRPPTPNRCKCQFNHRRRILTMPTRIKKIHLQKAN